MKKVNVTVQYDEEKYKAVKMYLEKKGKNLDDEIAGYMDTLFELTKDRVLNEVKAVNGAINLKDIINYQNGETE